MTIKLTQILHLSPSLLNSLISTHPSPPTFIPFFFPCFAKFSTLHYFFVCLLFQRNHDFVVQFLLCYRLYNTIESQFCHATNYVTKWNRKICNFIVYCAMELYFCCTMFFAITSLIFSFLFYHILISDFTLSVSPLHMFSTEDDTHPK